MSKLYKQGKMFEVENKDKRVQLLMQESLYKEIKGIAKKNNISVNGLIHNILRDYTSSLQSSRYMESK